MTNAVDSTTADIEVAEPFRLDLTVSALRRLTSNLVDVYTNDGRYLRAISTHGEAMVVSVRQSGAGRLTASVIGDIDTAPDAVAAVRRMLSVDCDVSEFHRQARKVAWLTPLARRMHGLKPPRYPTLFEACMNAVLFQQVSLHSASAILGRLVRGMGLPVEHDGIALIAFPTLDRFLGADDAELREAGVSKAKIATLRRLSEAIASEELREPTLEALPTPEAAKLLCEFKGIGPWTAAVILLRGLGRLDAFPGNDSGVAANLAFIAGESVDAAEVAESLGAQRGMLYFNLLLARLEARGELGRASDVAVQGSSD